MSALVRILLVLALLAPCPAWSMQSGALPPDVDESDMSDEEFFDEDEEDEDDPKAATPPPAAAATPARGRFVPLGQLTRPDKIDAVGSFNDEVHVVVIGEDFWAIAEKFLGDGRLWPLLLEVNTAEWGNPSAPRPGSKVRVGRGKARAERHKARKERKKGKGKDKGRDKPDKSERQAKGGPLSRKPLKTLQITSDFGPRNTGIPGASTYHKGVDLGAAGGSPVYATGPGKVVTAGAAGGAGNMIEIAHKHGIVTQYMHLKGGSMKVRVGTKVIGGQQIAGVNCTGICGGDHLHFGVKKNGRFVNPAKYFKRFK